MIKIKTKLKLFISLTFLFLMIFSLNKSFATDDNEITCRNAIVYDVQNDSILYSKGAFDKIYPASTTKILTAILTIENLDLNKSVVVSQKIIDELPPYSSSMKLKAGELIKVNDLLYGLMLSSGNDAALVLAETISYSTKDFVDLMNKKATEIGCKNTHFNNPHGYHDDNHYTTAYDMALILKYALNNETFRELISTIKYDISATNTSEIRECINTNKLINPEFEEYFYEFCIGGKTGYTEEAINTLITYGTKDGKEIIVGVFGNNTGHQFINSKNLYENTFNNFSFKNIINASNFKINIHDSKNTTLIYELIPSQDINSLLNDKNYSITYLNINIDYDTLEKNIKNKTVGSVDIIINGENILINRSCDLIINNITYNKNKINYIFWIKLILIIILTISLLTLSIIKIITRIKNKDLDTSL